MNKSKGNMYEFITHTWNPLAGECLHKCSYCSTNKLKRYPVINEKYSGIPRICRKSLKENLGKDNFIFVCAQNDLFAKDIKQGIINNILYECSLYNNKYLFQTKNPEMVLDYIDCSVVSDKSVICTTIESNRDYPVSDAPKMLKRAEAMKEISKIVNTYLTIEPILDFDLVEFVELVKMCNPKQVNIGADSGNNNLPEPSKEKILSLIFEIEKFTKVNKKKNLSRLL